MSEAFPREMSPGACALYLLVWGRPTDRALAGWEPWYGADVLAAKSETEFVKWMTGQLTMTAAERDSHCVQGLLGPEDSGGGNG